MRKKIKLSRLNIEKIRPLIDFAVREDLGSGDITTELMGGLFIAETKIVSREECIICGMEVVREVLRYYSKQLVLNVLVEDGINVPVGCTIGKISGPIGPMLSAERVMLNFLQKMSGVATVTCKYVNAIKGTKAKFYDTRKTTPGWRLLEKYAVRCGGGYNHRAALNEGILVKDNHFAYLGINSYTKLEKLVERAKQIKNIKFIGVEVDQIDDQLQRVLRISGIDFILLDNMGLWQLKKAVQMRDKICSNSKKPLLEASGNITLENISTIAQCGVDRVSVGAITHSASVVDIGLDVL